MSRRDYKEFAPGSSYHVYNRGNNKMDICRDEQDYRNFLWRLRILLALAETPRSSGIRLTPCQAGAFSLISYCLMPNHFHLEIQQNGEEPISLLMLKLLSSYSKYFNRKYTHVGHVFQDQFKAILIETDNQAAALSAYIHQNPVVAGLVREAAHWSWSSYGEYAGGQRDLADVSILLTQFPNNEAYLHFVDDQLPGILERTEINHLLLD